MDIELKSKDIQAAVTESINKGILDSVTDWQFQKSVKDTVAEGFEKHGFFDELNKAIAEELKENMSTVAQAVAKEIARASTRMAMATIGESMVNVVFQLRKVDYMNSEDTAALKAKIKAELFRNKK